MAGRLLKGPATASSVFRVHRAVYINFWAVAAGDGEGQKTHFSWPPCHTRRETDDGRRAVATAMAGFSMDEVLCSKVLKLHSPSWPRAISCASARLQQLARRSWRRRCFRRVPDN